MDLSQLKSIAGEEMTAAYVTINLVRTKTCEMEPYRKFVVCPNGSIIEPLINAISTLDAPDNNADEATKGQKDKHLKGKLTVCVDCRHWDKGRAAVVCGDKRRLTCLWGQA